MKQEIHPEYNEIKATCSCGNVIETRSTLAEDIHLEVCSNCHPFYTGKQKILDSGGRVERFRKRFGNRTTTRDAGDGADASDASEATEAPEAPEAKEATESS